MKVKMSETRKEIFGHISPVSKHDTAYSSAIRVISKWNLSEPSVAYQLPNLSIASSFPQSLTTYCICTYRLMKLQLAERTH